MQLQTPLFSVPAHLERLYNELKTLQRAQIAETTRKGYAHDWSKFSRWCERMHLAALPASPDTLALFIADLLTQGRKVTTVSRYAAGVAYKHTHQGYESPLTQKVKDALWGARRIRAEQPRQMIPVTVEQVRAIAASLAAESTAIAARDRAIVIVGFTSALRRANLATLELADVRLSSEGLLIRVRREKQDPTGGRDIAVPFGRDPVTCPGECLAAWLERRGRGQGPLFTRLDDHAPRLAPLSKNAIGDIVKKAIGRIVDPAGYGPHSLRAGLISEAGSRGCNHLVIASQSGHKSLDSLKRYFRPVDLFKANAAASLGL